MKKRESFSVAAYGLLTVALVGTMLLCVCAGSVDIPLEHTLTVLWRGMLGREIPEGISGTIILSVRLPRVLCTALSGAALALCGAAMQGVLRNPLADGSTLGVTSGASLGAVVAMAFDIVIPGVAYGGTMIMAMVFAFGSLLLILSLAYALDKRLATTSIILIGVIFSMFASSLITLIITFANEKIRSITFWTMGSFSGSNYDYCLLLGLALAAAEIALSVFIYWGGDNMGRTASGLLLLGSLSVLYFSALILTFVIYVLFIQYLPHWRRYDYIIIHGCGLIDGERVSKLLASRIDRAIRVFRRGKGRAILIPSGGQGPDERLSEAEAMPGVTSATCRISVSGSKRSPADIRECRTETRSPNT